MADDIEWVVAGPANVPMAGTYRGKAAMQSWFDTLNREVEFHRFEPYAFIAEGDMVVVLVDAPDDEATTKEVSLVIEGLNEIIGD